MSKEGAIWIQTCRFGDAKEAIAGELGRGTISGSKESTVIPSEARDPARDKGEISPVPVATLLGDREGSVRRGRA